MTREGGKEEWWEERNNEGRGGERRKDVLELDPGLTHITINLGIINTKITLAKACAQ